MDNKAFQDLVRGGAVSKSTKEIARDAVQDEFKRRKRKHKGYGSSDEEDYNNQDRKNKSRRDRDSTKPVFKTEKGAKKTNKKDSEENNPYRDRAKERREGKMEQQPVLSDDDELLESAMNQENSHHVESNKTSAETLPMFCRDYKEATNFISGNPKVTSSQGQDMLDYLRFIHNVNTKVAAEGTKEVTAVALAIQRTVLTFTTVANPGSRIRAWELPKELTFAKTNAQLFRKACFCPEDLLQKMERVYNQQNVPISSNGNPVSKSSKKKDAKSDSEEDDDIFGDLQEYDPLVSSAKNDDDKQASSKSKSFFSEDGREDVQKETKDGTATGSNTQAPPVGTTRLAGLSSYAGDDGGAGGYGEEMDVDFDGRFEEDDETKKKKKKKKKSADDEDDD